MRRALPPGAQPEPKPQTRAAAPRGRAVVPAVDAEAVAPTRPTRPAVTPTLRGRDRHRLTLTVR